MRSRLQEATVKAKYGFLYTGYSKDCYFWETALLVRKTAVIALIELLARFGTTVQTMSAVTVVFFAYVHHLHARPYDNPLLDVMEKVCGNG